MHAVDFSTLLLRLVLGTVMGLHGWNHLLGAGGVDGTARWFASMGLRPPRLHAWVSGTLEIAAGAGLVVGLFTPLAGAAVLGIVVVAGVTAHRKNGFFIFRDGYEYVMTIAAMVLALLVLGPGQWSIDAAIGLKFSGVAPAVSAGVAAALGSTALLAACWRPQPAS